MKIHCALAFVALLFSGCFTVGVKENGPLFTEQDIKMCRWTGVPGGDIVFTRAIEFVHPKFGKFIVATYGREDDGEFVLQVYRDSHAPFGGVTRYLLLSHDSGADRISNIQESSIQDVFRLSVSRNMDGRFRNYNWSYVGPDSFGDSGSGVTNIRPPNSGTNWYAESIGIQDSSKDENGAGN